VTVGTSDPDIEGPSTFGSRKEPLMTSDPSQQPVSPLRARMIEDMTVHGFNERTRSHYVRHMRAFAAFLGRSPDTATGGWLFPGRNPVEPLSARQLCRAVRAAQSAGIKKRVSPHTLRHSFATHLLEQDVDIRVIQTLLGHAKLDTTALYTRVANTTIRAVTSPLDRLAPLIEGRPRPEA